MANNSAPSDSDAEKFTLQRRKFIRTCLRQTGKVTQREMTKWLADRDKSWSLKAMRNDIDFIEKYEDKSIFAISTQVSGEFEWVDNSKKFGLTREDRLQHNIGSKIVIAEVLASVVLGFSKISIIREQSREPGQVNCRDKVLNALKSCDSNPLHAAESAANKLQNYWKLGERRLFLDAGTTTQVFADGFVKYFHFPMQGDVDEDASDASFESQCVNRLEVVTNDRYIYYTLGDASVDARTIVVGGHQQYYSAAISGAMAEQFLDSTKITADIAIVGATAICLRNTGTESYIAAENEHVANIKLRFLERADIRIVVADSTKFYHSGGHTDFRICPLLKKYVDIVITDSADAKSVDSFRKLGIPLIAAKQM